jgi:hypothetical protein
MQGQADVHESHLSYGGRAQSVGGNRTEHGAHTQSVLVSILQTCVNNFRPAAALLQQLLHLPEPKALEPIPITPR